MKVAIFPGHVGKDSGAIVTRSPHTIEAVINLGVATLVTSQLRQANIDVLMFSGTLPNRVARANAWGANMGISLHCDWLEKNTANGMHMLIYSRESQAFDLGVRIANTWRNYVSDIKCRSDSFRERKRLYVLKATEFPTLLIEMGFLSNDNDRAALNVDLNRIKIANAIVSGVTQYAGTQGEY